MNAPSQAAERGVTGRGAAAEPDSLTAQGRRFYDRYRHYRRSSIYGIRTDGSLHLSVTRHRRGQSIPSKPAILIGGLGRRKDLRVKQSPRDSLP